MIGATVTLGRSYLPTSTGTITRSTPTQWVVEMDDGREARLRRDTMAEVGSGCISAYRIIDASDVAGERETYHRDARRMNDLHAANIDLLHALDKLRPGYGRRLGDIADDIRRKTVVDIELATRQILECADTLRKLVGVTNG